MLVALNLAEQATCMSQLICSNARLWRPGTSGFTSMWGPGEPSWAGRGGWPYAGQWSDVGRWQLMGQNDPDPRGRRRNAGGGRASQTRRLEQRGSLRQRMDELERLAQDLEKAARPLGVVKEPCVGMQLAPLNMQLSKHVAQTCPGGTASSSSARSSGTAPRSASAAAIAVHGGA